MSAHDEITHAAPGKEPMMMHTSIAEEVDVAEGSGVAAGDDDDMYLGDGVQPATGSYSDLSDDLYAAANPMQDFSNVMFTLFGNQEGDNLVDILKSLRDALDKQNKILYKVCQVLEHQHSPAAAPR